MFWKLFNLEQAPQPKAYENTNEWNLWFIDVRLKINTLYLNICIAIKSAATREESSRCDPDADLQG